jgi:Arc/MetJ-type ribon-helix-helix transcriptional regulator
MWLNAHMGGEIKMGKMNVVLTDELENKFRKTVYEKKGYKKGNISEAINEAVECWIEEQNKPKKSEKHG